MRSQNDRVYAVLADGKPHAMREVHARAGFMRLNSRISELRSKRNLFIYCWHADGDWNYQLITLDEAAVAAPIGAGRPAASSSVGDDRDDPSPLGDRRPAPQQQLLIWENAA